MLKIKLFEKGTIKPIEIAKGNVVYEESDTESRKVIKLLGIPIYDTGLIKKIKIEHEETEDGKRVGFK